MGSRAGLANVSMSVAGRLAQQPLHDDAVPPLAEKPAMPTVHPDHTEPSPFMQDQARLILGKDS